MEKIYRIACLFIALLSVVACENEKGDSLVTEAPELPPFESMAMDYSQFVDSKSASTKGLWMNDNIQNTESNYNLFIAGTSVGVWNLVLFTTLAVPVAAFQTAFQNDPERISNRKFQWTYGVNGFGSQYMARLTGELMDNEAVWEMYISKTGFGAFEELLWFDGRSAVDQSSGYWLINHSAAHPEKLLRVDWEKKNGEIDGITYTYVRELNDQGVEDSFKNSSIHYGKQTGDYDLYYDIHAFSENDNAFVDTDIEWSSSANFGRIKAPQHFSDEEWHCWANDGHDVDCE